MKRMTKFGTVPALMAPIAVTVLAALPQLASAHGAHAPVPEASHGLAHLVPALAVIVLAVVVALGAMRRRGRRDWLMGQDHG